MVKYDPACLLAQGSNLFESVEIMMATIASQAFKAVSTISSYINMPNFAIFSSMFFAIYGNFQHYSMSVGTIFGNP